MGCCIRLFLVKRRRHIAAAGYHINDKLTATGSVLYGLVATICSTSAGSTSFGALCMKLFTWVMKASLSAELFIESPSEDELHAVNTSTVATAARPLMIERMVVSS